jgi:NADH-quinone oxidoreductase subunit I
VKRYLVDIGRTARSLWEGLSVTLSYMLQRPITVQYAGPDAKTDTPVQHLLPSRFRGLLEVDMETCTACQACERACPINVIAIGIEKLPENPKQRVMTRFDIDVGKCMFCGLCVEPCPTGSIQHTREFEGSQRFLPNMVMRFVDPTKPALPYRPPKGAVAYPRKVLGEINSGLLKAWDSAPLPVPKGEPRVPTPGQTRELVARAVGATGQVLVDLLEQAQAGLDCGECTYLTCRAYAEGLASGKEQRPALCKPGGEASASTTRQVLGTARR